VRFTTAKGSTYQVHDDGTTTRDKAARPEHPGEQGPQPRSERTVYVTPEEATRLGGDFQTQGGPGKEIAEHSSGAMGVRYTEGKDAGKFERRTLVKHTTEPEVGKVPVEIWDGGKRAHFGNKITELTGREPAEVRSEGGPAPSHMAGEAPAHAVTPKAEVPVERGPPPKAEAAVTVSKGRGRPKKVPETVPETVPEVVPESVPAVDTKVQADARDDAMEKLATVRRATPVRRGSPVEDLVNRAFAEIQREIGQFFEVGQSQMPVDAGGGFGVLEIFQGARDQDLGIGSGDARVFEGHTLALQDHR